MEAHAQAEPAGAAPRQGPPTWLLGLLPLALIAAAVALFAALGGPGLGERTGPPAEELAVERTVLRPGEIELTLRNEGPDPVTLAQVLVNEAYTDFAIADRELGRLEAGKLTIHYPWIDEQPVAIALLLSTGATIEHEVEVAVTTPETDLGFYGLMALIGIYVGVIPVSLGMLWLPFVRRIRAHWLQAIFALTIGLLGFLALDGLLEGLELAEGAVAFGGAELVLLGAIGAYLALAAVDSFLGARATRAAARGASGEQLALMVAIGIGLHNLGEGVAIGAAYAVGALALGAFLIVGFALHNTTEGLAIVAPLARRSPTLARLVALGLIAGAPAILGAWIGASAFNASLAALLFGVGVGAIVRVVQQLWPQLRDRAGQALNPISVAGIATGALVLYATGLLISV